MRRAIGSRKRPHGRARRRYGPSAVEPGQPNESERGREEATETLAGEPVEEEGPELSEDPAREPPEGGRPMEERQEEAGTDQQPAGRDDSGHASPAAQPVDAGDEAVTDASEGDDEAGQPGLAVSDESAEGGPRETAAPESLADEPARLREEAARLHEAALARQAAAAELREEAARLREEAARLMEAPAQLQEAAARLREETLGVNEQFATDEQPVYEESDVSEEQPPELAEAPPTTEERSRRWGRRRR